MTVPFFLLNEYVPRASAPVSTLVAKKCLFSGNYKLTVCVEIKLKRIMRGNVRKNTAPTANIKILKKNGKII